MRVRHQGPKEIHLVAVDSVWLGTAHKHHVLLTDPLRYRGRSVNYHHPQYYLTLIVQKSDPNVV